MSGFPGSFAVTVVRGEPPPYQKRTVWLTDNQHFMKCSWKACSEIITFHFLHQLAENKILEEAQKQTVYKCVGRVVTIWFGSWYFWNMWMYNLHSCSLKWGDIWWGNWYLDCVFLIWCVVWCGQLVIFITFSWRLRIKTTCGRDFVFYLETLTLGLCTHT